MEDETSNDVIEMAQYVIRKLSRSEGYQGEERNTEAGVSESYQDQKAIKGKRETQRLSRG